MAQRRLGHIELGRRAGKAPGVRYHHEGRQIIEFIAFHSCTGSISSSEISSLIEQPVRDYLGITIEWRLLVALEKHQRSQTEEDAPWPIITPYPKRIFDTLKRLTAATSWPEPLSPVLF